ARQCRVRYSRTKTLSDPAFAASSTAPSLVSAPCAARETTPRLSSLRQCRVRHHDEDLSDPAFAASPTAPSLDLPITPLGLHRSAACGAASAPAGRQTMTGGFIVAAGLDHQQLSGFGAGLAERIQYALHNSPGLR